MSKTFNFYVYVFQNKNILPCIPYDYDASIGTKMNYFHQVFKLKTSEHLRILHEALRLATLVVHERVS